MDQDRHPSLLGELEDGPEALVGGAEALRARVELDPAQAEAKDICLAMMRRGVLTKETHDTVIRFAPPLVIEEADLLTAVEVFHDALEETAAPHAMSCAG